MKFWVGVTDTEWFNFLSNIAPDEVNFWQPSGNVTFQALKPGELFLFKLHSPFNFITGGGFFVNFSRLPISVAWQTFGEKNGAASYELLRSRIMKYRVQHKTYEPDPMIGCIILTSPFFFTKDEWIPVPKDWNPSLVRGKTYDYHEPIGAALWLAVQERIQNKSISKKVNEKGSIFAEESSSYGTEYLIRARLGQGAFRVLVTEAYQRRCGITGERTLPVLEAAHIKPYLTITNDFNVEISKRIKEEYENGRDYYLLHGNKLKAMPSNVKDCPSREYIEWHNQNIYVP
ncbi:MAG: Restriction endonuclease, putative restriction endonuclease [Candidatus Dadabacteria bacterium]|nr:Restriction endonuclease, putative restriction endonuclease [Candidatus Dadabacteria bacterium]